jgi:hypothetical protein
MSMMLCTFYSCVACCASKSLKAPRYSITSTARFFGKPRCETFERFFLRVLRNSNWSVVAESVFVAFTYGRKPALWVLANTIQCVLSESSAIRKLSRNGIRGDRSASSVPVQRISSKRTFQKRKVSLCKKGSCPRCYGYLVELFQGYNHRY